MLGTLILFAATPTNTAEVITIIVAYGVAGLGPVVGTYMFIKSSGKIFGAVSGAVSKFGAGIQKRGNDWAGRMQKRSTFGQMQTARGAAGDSNAQRRAYGRMGGKFRSSVATFGLSGDQKQLMETQINDSNDKIMDQGVKYSLQGIRKDYNAKDRDSDENGNGIHGLVREARIAAENGDQVRFNALAAHALSGGADEYRMFHKGLQGTLGDKHKRMFDGSMAYSYATQGDAISSKSPSLAEVLQGANSSTDLFDAEYNNLGKRKQFNKVNAAAHASFSSDEAKAAALFASDAVIKELIENPGGKHSLGAGARKAYEAEYYAMTKGGGRKYKNGVGWEGEESNAKIIDTIPNPEKKA